MHQQSSSYDHIIVKHMFLVACSPHTSCLCDPGLCNFMGARGRIMLFVWQGTLPLSACSHIKAQKGNFNCHMASAQGNTVPLLHITTSLMCTFSHKLEKRRNKEWAQAELHTCTCLVLVAL